MSDIRSRPYISWWFNYRGRTGFAFYPVILGRFQPRIAANILLPPRKLFRFAVLEFNRKGYKNLLLLEIELIFFHLVLMVDYFPPPEKDDVP